MSIDTAKSIVALLSKSGLAVGANKVRAFGGKGFTFMVTETSIVLPSF